MATHEEDLHASEAFSASLNSQLQGTSSFDMHVAGADARQVCAKDTQTESICDTDAKVHVGVQTTETLGETLERRRQQLHVFFAHALADCSYVSCEIIEASSRTEIIITGHDTWKMLGHRSTRIRELTDQLRSHFEIPLEREFALFIERC